MLVVRPAGSADFDSLMELAVLSGRGFTSLPEDEPTLRERLALSEASFQAGVAPLEAWYTLMLEDLETGVVDGVAGVKAAVGIKRPFFSFRVVTLAQSSPVLEMRFDHKALVLVNECAGWSEVGSLFLRPEKRKGGAGRLLAQSRYMLIGIEPQRFSEMVLAELRGWFDEYGSCPFWEHAASKFFRLEFDQADLMSASTNGQFILDLAPRHPIYTELLAPAARDVIGKVHRDGEAARAMLEREGFRYQGLVDLFDAGPTVAAPRDDIRTVRDARRLRVKIGEDAFGEEALISTTEVSRFRAVRAAVLIDGEAAILDRATADALGVGEGDSVRVKA
ncbi:arginine N-succinyltransferase [Caulobacter zeae]|uniref:Arginine N-succinyltransferase n=1 Tax=Caulobacter zeae TaxID=2055137 RepID=A0A2N5DKH2_9CAUL|nr:arginine N-succinyltransferase [Caulobacter zeae]PLR26561.1 arginine N-succinyltransferase [Caulobacter zeae]